MSARFIHLDRQTPMLFPPDLKDWVSEDSIVHFIIDAVDALNLNGFKTNTRGSGKAQYSPSMMLCLLIYSYATGVFSSRKIEQSTWNNVEARYICGGNLHPDHDTICTFRKENKSLFQEMFVKVLLLATEVGQLKKVGGISVDGTKIKANASKHKAVSYKRAQKKIEQLKLEVEELTAKAEQMDSTPLEDGMTIPDEIKRRKQRIAKLSEAQKIIEMRYKEVKKSKQEDYEEKMKKRKKLEKEGKKPRGKAPTAPSDNPPDKAQFNFTDSESRIMKAGNSSHFDQCYNAQAAVDAEGSMLVLDQYVTEHVNDKLELSKISGDMDEGVRKAAWVLADSGYFSEQAVKAVEENENGPTVYCAVEREYHHKTVQDIEKSVDPPPPSPDASWKKKMTHRLKTKEGRLKYKKRKETVEPVFGIIKSVMGFRNFSLRGLEKVGTEWNLVTLSYNIKRLHKLMKGGVLSSAVRCGEVYA